MVRARVVDDEARTIASTRYVYDPLGRRTLVQDNNTTTLRTLYDGLGFDVVKESPVYSSGGFVDTYNTGIQYSPAGYATGERYRYLDDGQGTSEKYQYIEDNAYKTVSSRYTGERTMLYAHGSPVAVNRSSGTRGYLGTDILGSTRSVTDNHGVQESYYDYDIFGSPITGNYTTGADYGYLGKPYDSITGLYNYGYRDYSPQSVRFTTVDPIRDGANWFAYVNNDPVNYVDLWGLLASDGTVQQEDITQSVTTNGIPQLNGTPEQFVETQRALVGTPYVWGGKNPDTYGGLDCSGAVLYGVNQLGNDIPVHDANSIYHNLTVPVERNDMKPGDLRFLDNEADGRIDHVQVIVGKDGSRVNATGTRINTRENPGIIELLPGPLPQSGEIRRLNFQGDEE